MLTKQALVQEAVKWIGRPYSASGTQECGANCLGVFGGILRNLGGLEGLVAEIEKHAKYARPIHSGQLFRLLTTSKYLETIRPKRLETGNFLLIRFAGEPQHMAIITEPGIVLHASGPHKRVIQHGLPRDWKIVCEFKIIGLQ